MNRAVPPTPVSARRYPALPGDPNDAAAQRLWQRLNRGPLRRAEVLPPCRGEGSACAFQSPLLVRTKGLQAAELSLR